MNESWNDPWNMSCMLSNDSYKEDPNNHSLFVLFRWPKEWDRLIEQGCNCSSIAEESSIINLYCQESPWKHSVWAQALYIFLFGVIILMAIGGNCIVIWIVLAHERMRTITNYFLLNLALSDALISLFNVCFSFTFNLYYDWFFGSAYCHFNNFMGVTPTCASVFTLIAMSLDRYVAIVNPLKPHLSQKKTVFTIVAIWILATLCGLPNFLASTTNAHWFYTTAAGPKKDVICVPDNFPDGNALNGRLHSIYQNFLLVINYILPLVVLTVTYTKVGIVLWGSHVGEHVQHESMRAKRKVVKMMAVVVLIFMVCWLPYHLYFTVFMRILSDHFKPQTVLYIYLNIYWLAMSSTIFNPIIYCYMNSRFRMGFRYIFRWLPWVHVSQAMYKQSDLVLDPRKASYAVTMHRLRNLPVKRRVPREPHSPSENGRLISVTNTEEGRVLESPSFPSNQPADTFCEQVTIV